MAQTRPSQNKSSKDHSFSHGHTTKVRVIAITVILIVISFTWIYSGWRLEAVGSVASILAILCWALEKFFPSSLKGSFNLNIVIKYIIFSVVPIAFISCYYASYDLLISDERQYKNAMYLIINLSIVCIFFTSITLLSLWRSWMVNFLSVKHDMAHATVQSAYDGLIEIQQVLDSDNRERFYDYINEILERGALSLGLNPSEKIKDIIFPFNKPFGAASLWYLEPDPNDSQKNFRICHYSAPEMPQEGRKFLERIKLNHKPSKYDEVRYKEAERLSYTDGKLDLEKFKSHPDRESFVSIAGYIFKTGDTIASHATESSVLFSPIRKEVFGEPIPQRLKPWFRFVTYAAYPVFSCMDDGKQPRGVLLAFKNTPEPFVVEDRNVLVITSRLLGILCTQPQNSRGSS